LLYLLNAIGGRKGDKKDTSNRTTSVPEPGGLSRPVMGKGVRGWERKRGEYRLHALTLQDEAQRVEAGEDKPVLSARPTTLKRWGPRRSTMALLKIHGDAKAYGLVIRRGAGAPKSSSENKKIVRGAIIQKKTWPKDHFLLEKEKKK